VIVDCYNANPQSVRAALKALVDHETATARVAVLGSMLELGGRSEALHDSVLADALREEIELVVATGAFADAARRAGATEGHRLLSAHDWNDA